MIDFSWETGRKGLNLLLQGDVLLAGLLEKPLLWSNWSSDKPQLFILGLPRTGTTLTYQYIVHRLNVAYFTNGVGRYHLAPCLATWLQQHRHEPYHSDFTSNYGSVTGPMAPHEAGRFWGRFFGFQEYVTPDQIPARHRRTMRRTLAFVQALFGNSLFVNKNVKHLLRIPALHAVFPDAYFLRVQRNWEDVALSLLRARHANLEDPTTWWSARPPNHRALENRPVDEQIAHQIAALDEKINEDLARLPSNHVFSIDYRSFCENPDRLIRKIRLNVSDIGFRNSAVQHFPPSTNAPKTEVEERLIARMRDLAQRDCQPE